MSQCDCVSKRTHTTVKSLCDKFAYWAWYRPGSMLCVSLILTLMCAAGFARLTIESDLEDLYIPRTRGPTWTNRQFFLTHFGVTKVPSWIIFESTNKFPTGTINRESFGNATKLVNKIHALTTTYNGKTVTYDDVCRLTPTGICSSRTAVFSLWNFNVSKLYEWSDIQLQQKIYQYSVLAGPMFNAIFASTRVNKTSRRVTYAHAFVMQFPLNVKSSVDDEKKKDAWETEFLNFMANNNNVQNFDVFYMSGVSNSLETSRTMTNTIPFFIAALGIMLLFLMFTMGTHWDCIRMRLWLPCVFLPLLLGSLIIGFGLGSAIGIQMNTIAILIAFILIGVGVDDVLVIVEVYDRADHPRSIDDFNDLTELKTSLADDDRSDWDWNILFRLQHALEHAGSSLSVTTITTVVGFSFGTIVDIPGARAFSVFSAFSFAAIFALQFLIFVPILVTDERRIAESRWSVCPCMKPPQRCRIADDEQRSPVSHQPTSTTIEAEQISYGTICINKYWIPFISLCNGWMKFLLTMLVVGLIPFSVISSNQVKAGQGQTDHLPDESYFGDFLNKLPRLFDNRQPITMNIVFRDIEWSDQTQFTKFDALEKQATDFSFIGGFVNAWPNKFRQWIVKKNQSNMTTATVFSSKTSFYSSLKLFYQEDVNVQKDILLNSNTNPTSISVSRTGILFFVPPEFLQVWDEAQKVQTLVESNGFSSSFITSNIMLWGFFVSVIRFLTWETIGFSSLGVFLVLVTFIPTDFAILVFMTVAMIDVSLFAWMFVFDLPLNAISYIMIMASLGLVVDYCVHIALYFIEELHNKSRPSNEERLFETLRNMGAIVMKAFVTTILGSFILLFSSSKLFRDFFALFLGVITMAGVHALLFLPFLLFYYVELRRVCGCAVEVNGETNGNAKEENVTDGEKKVTDGEEQLNNKDDVELKTMNEGDLPTSQETYSGPTRVV